MSTYIYLWNTFRILRCAFKVIYIKAIKSATVHIYLIITALTKWSINHQKNIFTDCLEYSSVIFTNGMRQKTIMGIFKYSISGLFSTDFVINVYSIHNYKEK